jgi:hypothetical protein
MDPQARQVSVVSISIRAMLYTDPERGELKADHTNCMSGLKMLTFAAGS